MKYKKGDLVKWSLKPNLIFKILADKNSDTEPPIGQSITVRKGYDYLIIEWDGKLSFQSFYNAMEKDLDLI